ncbi:Anaphase-promoting complex (APC), subunit 11 [Handroanthus impetiginosus]|uniref:Anaphase-promoting complex (APC), subunit 11 n=1 Tax=Handroanthus impetiginosus TaxID=429701 RepID=A0A2G9GQS5_9LAMI|nr:Anaphase-promoting complex (APC), subunit 11 [Handroanthus impetiginosus]
MGGSKWMKAKMALGLKLNSCLYVPRTVEDSPTAAGPPLPGRFSDAVSLSPTPPRDSDHRVRMPTTPTPSSSGLLLPKHSSKSSKKICAICLMNMKPGHGHAIFTAECSHSFHFHCITSNVKYGKQSCPVCRAKWKEIPFQGPATDKSHERARINNVSWSQDDAWMPAVRRIPSSRADGNQQVSSLFHAAEPGVFDDDDEISGNQPGVASNSSSSNNNHTDHFTGSVEVKMYPEVSAVPKSKSHNNFTILVHLKAPVNTGPQHSHIDGAHLPLISQTSRAPVDLVTVLDVSGSMAGTKLALLKRAMGFVIQNLGPSDRLSVIAFSSTARRLIPLRRMTDTGRHEALQAVNSLSSNGGTNIAEGLKKGAKVMTDRKWKNPVSSIVLLSDGQDTYTITSPSGGKTRSNSQSLLPVSMHQNSASGLHIPVHAFGFGADHDAVSMHLISETSGGTFSFIETESVIQDAFAQCIGGLLSVVVQELKVEVKCIDPKLRLVSMQSGSYKTVLASDKRKGSIEVGDLYAEEERDFLVTTDIPIDESADEMSILKVKCVYKHPVSKSLVTIDSTSVLKIQRPVITGPLVVSMEVDKQRNRLRSAEAMAEARAAAEQGDLTSAVSILESFRKQLSETMSAQAGDRLCISLDAELREMQERMANRRVYETSGRAYVLSGLSSHSWQRATARGDSTDSTSLVQAYQTPSMVDMVNLSQTMILGHPLPRPAIRPTRSFPARPQPR